MLQVILLQTFFNDKNEYCATLTNGTVSATCEDVLYTDFVDNDARIAVFNEWCELADAGEDGYYKVTHKA